jgi:sRNA-binding carbon storage regulator CsrA
MPRLCLSLHEGRKIRVGADVWIELVRIDGHGGKRKARLVVTAPAEVLILREELIASVEGGANGTPASLS